MVAHGNEQSNILTYLQARIEAYKKGLKRFKLIAPHDVYLTQGSQEDERIIAQDFLARVTEDLSCSVLYPQDVTPACSRMTSGGTKIVRFRSSPDNIVQIFDKAHSHIQMREISFDKEGNNILDTTIVTNDCQILKNPHIPLLEVRCKNKMLYKFSGIERVECDGTDVTKKLENDWSEQHVSNKCMGCDLEKKLKKAFRRHRVKKN